MIPRIIRIALMSIVILILAIELPPIYRTLFEQKGANKEYKFSEILEEFVEVSYSYDTTRMRNVQTGVDIRGKTYDKDEFISLFPTAYYRQLIHENRFPDSIKGIHVTPEMIEESGSFPLFLGVSNLNRPLLWMFESNTDRIARDIPNDMFRIAKEGIEFINTGKNRIEGVNKEKSKLFTDALDSIGFSFPTVNIYGTQSTQKMYDEGFFIKDSEGDFFHLKMTDGLPVCCKVPIPEGIDIISMNILDSPTNYGYVYDQDYNIYFLTKDNYNLSQLDIHDYKDFKSTIVMQENLFYNIYVLYGKSGSKYYVMDKENNVVASKEVGISDYRKTQVGQLENYFFPFKITILKSGDKGLSLDWCKFKMFIILNLVLMIIMLGLKIYNRNSLKNIFNIIDLGIIMLTGIYGFVATLIFPQRK